MFILGHIPAKILKTGKCLTVFFLTTSFFWGGGTVLPINVLCSVHLVLKIDFTC